MKSANYDARRADINMVVLHYTGMRDCEAALARLCDPRAKVSAHYLIDEDGTCHALVDEDKRAWHAGIAYWAGMTDINSCSIGIEIVNGGREFGLPDFPPPQMAAVEDLCVSLAKRYSMRYLLGHSDVAPGRKEDPGEKFDWPRLARMGLGLWGDPPPPDQDFSHLDQAAPKLKRIGYDPRLAPEILLTAFQRHYRPARIDGRLDRSTAMTLDRILSQL